MSRSRPPQSPSRPPTPTIPARSGSKPPGRGRPATQRPQARPETTTTRFAAFDAPTVRHSSTSPDASTAKDVNAVPPVRLPSLTDFDAEGTRTDRNAIIAPRSTRSGRRPQLLVMTGVCAGQVFDLDKEAVIGRTKEAHIRLPDAGISRVHASVSRKGADYFIEDLGSTNGTIVNGLQITRIALRVGDRIQLGPEAVLQFGLPDEAEAALSRSLYEAATRDPLTHAFNRRAFFERLEPEISYARRHKASLCAVMFDVDHFKKVNDQYGHAAGDAVLRELSNVVRTTIRTEDTFARYGGEEFVLLGRGLALEAGERLAERVRLAIANHTIRAGDVDVHVTISAGVAELSECDAASSNEKLLALADERLYRAKAGGRNRVICR